MLYCCETTTPARAFWSDQHLVQMKRTHLLIREACSALEGAPILAL